MAISMSELKKGLKIDLEGIPYKITDYQHVKPGKGAAFVRCKIRNLLNTKVIDKTFHAGDKCEKPDLATKSMQYLYDDGELFQFMDNDTYEQIGLSEEQVGDSEKWIIEGMSVDVLFFNGDAISIEPKAVVELKVVETDPGLRGNTATNATKSAKMETGLEIKVPLFINKGDILKIDTKSGDYSERVKN